MRYSFLLTGISVLLAGCGWQMAEQPRLDPYERTNLTANGSSALRPPSGTVPVTTTDEEQPELSKALLERGREGYDIYCALCHGPAGYGDGRIVERGFPAPPSFHSPELVAAEDLHYWSAISNGAGRMLPYADRVSPRDRWAIVAWIRVLQLSEREQAVGMPPTPGLSTPTPAPLGASPTSDPHGGVSRPEAMP